MFFKNTYKFLCTFFTHSVMMVFKITYIKKVFSTILFSYRKYRGLNAKLGSPGEWSELCAGQEGRPLS